MLLKKKISELEQALDQAQTYTEWEQVGSELDALNGMDLWKIDNASPDYNYELIRDQLQTLRGYMNEKRIEPLMRLLRVGLNHDLGNMGNSNLYGRAHVGTKKLIEDYVDQVCTCLEYICNAQIDGITFGDKLDFFKDTRRSFGQPAPTPAGFQNIADHVCKGVISADQGSFPVGTTLSSCKENSESSFGFLAQRIINIFSLVVGVVACYHSTPCHTENYESPPWG